MINTYHTVVTFIGTEEDIQQFKTRHLDETNNIRLEVAAPLGGRDPVDVWGAPTCTTEHFEEEPTDEGMCVNVCVGSRGSIDRWFHTFATDNPALELHFNSVCKLINEKATLIYKGGVKLLEITAIPDEED